MKTRDEHLKLLSNYFNIAGAGTLVACVATIPLGALTSGRLSDWNLIDMMVISLLFQPDFTGWLTSY